MKTKPNCIYCNSNNVTSKGTKYRKKTKTRVNDFYCKHCFRRFYTPFNENDTNPLIENEMLSNEAIDHEKQVDIDLSYLTLNQQKTIQKYMDRQRIERKGFREAARYENAITDFNVALIDSLKNFRDKIPLNKLNSYVEVKNNNDEKIGIVHLSDLHFNELIKIDNVNLFDFKIAAKRLKLFASEIKKYFINANNIKKIVIALTGDLLNADSRLDKLLNQATNRANAAVLSCIILEQFIDDLAYSFDSIDILSVSGNESRIDIMKESGIGYSDIIVSNSYDCTIYNMLRLIYRNHNIVKFHNTNPSEEYIVVNHSGILLLHGHTFKHNNIDNEIQKIIGKYAARKKPVRFVLCGHIHTTMVSDYVSRSSSLCGNNSYADKGLHINGRAAQNIHIVDSNGNINSIKVDLQDYSNIKDNESYYVDDMCDCYNVSDKESDTKTIIKIVI